MCLLPEFFEKRQVVVDEYVKKGHIEIFNFLSSHNFSIQTLFQLNIIVYTGYENTAKLYDFVISDISKNILFHNKEYQIILIYADKVDLLRQMIESFSDNNNAPDIAHLFEASVKIDQYKVTNEILCIIEYIVEVLNSEPMSKIDMCITINANFPGGVPNRIKDVVNKNIQKIPEVEYKWD